MERKSDEELLAACLSCSSGRARKLLDSCGGAQRFFRMSRRDMAECMGRIGLRGVLKKCLSIESMVELVRRSYWWTDERELPEEISESAHAEMWFRSEMRLGDDRERFWVLPLDAALHPICRPVMVASGLLNVVPVGVREIFVEAVRMQASSIIIAHNHPSGDCSPSKKDLELTKELVKASAVLRTPLLDHVILGDGTYVSLKDGGYVKFETKMKKGEGRK